EQRSRLDDRGVVRAGTVLKDGDVVISLLRRLRPSKNKRAHEGKWWVQDDSLRATSEWQGAIVTSAEMDSGGISEDDAELPTEAPRVRIAVRAEHDLAIGDLLLYRQEALGLVVRFLPEAEMPQQNGQPVDLILPRIMAERLRIEPGSIVALGVQKGSKLAADS